jgi:hypothetical protein
VPKRRSQQAQVHAYELPEIGYQLDGGETAPEILPRDSDKVTGDFAVPRGGLAFCAAGVALQ